MPDQPESSRRMARHPIQVVARRTGLSADALRAWEKRYGAVSPARAPGGRRLYSDEDVERLLLLRQATDFGRRIGQVASLDIDELRELVGQDDRAQAAAPAPQQRGARPPGSVHLEACRDALRALDSARLVDLLARARVELTMPALIDDVLVPLIDGVGEGWREGNLGVAHEHLSTSVLRSLLGQQMHGRSGAPTDPAILLTTPAGQRHELGALLAAVTASVEGWRVTYLGPDLPAEEIASAVEQTGARCVALSIVYPTDDPHLPEELRRLAAQLRDDTVVFVGGRGAASYAELLLEIGARRIEGLPGFRKELERLRALAI